MKLFWLLLVVICIINETKSKSLRDNATDIINNDIAKSRLLSKPAVLSERRTLGLFPSLTHKVNKSSVSLKPVMKMNSKENVQKNRKPVMRKLEIKNENHKSKDTLRMKPATRRPLMTIRRFTIKPRHIHSESSRGRHVWDRKGRIGSHDSDSTSRNANKNNSRINEDTSSEHGVNTDSDSDELVKEVEINDNVAAASQTIKTVIFPRRNKTYPSTNINEQHISTSENVAVSIDKSQPKTLSNKPNADNKTVNNLNITSQEQRVKPENTSEGRVVSIKSDEVQKLTPLSKLGTIKDEVTTKSDIKILDLRPKRSVNIIEEEMVATSYPKNKITSRVFVLNYDLKFKNINT